MADYICLVIIVLSWTLLILKNFKKKYYIQQTGAMDLVIAAQYEKYSWIYHPVKWSCIDRDI